MRPCIGLCYLILLRISVLVSLFSLNFDCRLIFVVSTGISLELLHLFSLPRFWLYSYDRIPRFGLPKSSTLFIILVRLLFRASCWDCSWLRRIVWSSKMTRLSSVDLRLLWMLARLLYSSKVLMSPLSNFRELTIIGTFGELPVRIYILTAATSASSSTSYAPVMKLISSCLSVPVAGGQLFPRAYLLLLDTSTPGNPAESGAYLYAILTSVSFPTFRELSLDEFLFFTRPRLIRCKLIFGTVYTRSSSCGTLISPWSFHICSCLLKVELLSFSTFCISLIFRRIMAFFIRSGKYVSASLYEMRLTEVTELLTTWRFECTEVALWIGNYVRNYSNGLLLSPLLTLSNLKFCSFYHYSA